MTESEWLACPDPQRILEFLRGKASERKLRLFACACCRITRHLWLDDRLLRLLDGVEREADGQATYQDHQLWEDWEEEQQVLGDSWGLLDVDDERRRQILSRPHRQQAQNVEALQALQWVRDWDAATFLGEQGEEQVDALLAARATARTVTVAIGDSLPVRKAEAETLRDIFGNPFRPVRLAEGVLSWNDDCVLKLATAAYEWRRLAAGTLEPERLAVLADALEEAGCQNQDMLTHLREQQGQHWRGCWALDLLLGKI